METGSVRKPGQTSFDPVSSQLDRLYHQVADDLEMLFAQVGVKIAA
jgi:hypothetical protein